MSAVGVVTKYIGFYAGSSATAPANKAYYSWSMYVGQDGKGNGDMAERIYAPNATAQGLVGTVDRAIDATNASNLKKSNGEVVSADSVTTKLSSQVAMNTSGVNATLTNSSVSASTNYSSPLLRNIIYSTENPEQTDGNNGDIWIVYEEV